MIEERYSACEASTRSVGRIAEGVPPEQAAANSGPGRTSATTFLTWPGVVHVGAIGADIAIRATFARGTKVPSLRGDATGTFVRR